MCKIIREVLSSIIKRLGPLHLAPPTTETWVTNEVGFRNIWNHPHAIGALDGKHIRIVAASHKGSTHYNYKGFHSIVLLAIAAPDYKFAYIDIGAPGSQSDGGVFSRSSLGINLQNGSLGIPGLKELGGKQMPHVFLADDAFALKENLMKPYPGKFLEIS